MTQMDETADYFFLSKPDAIWRWEEGTVDDAREHILLEYGNIHTTSAKNWIPVARLSPPQGPVFTVEWLIEPGSPEHAAALDAGRRSLDFFLVELHKLDAWQYAIYHCSTAANLYSDVHWVHYIPGQSGG